MRLGVAAALVDGQIVGGDVEVADGIVKAIGLASRGGRCLAAPGLVDLQVNGLPGTDLVDADEEGYRQVGERLVAAGVTSYLPTFMTAPEDRLLTALGRVPERSSGARVLGVHLDGPFISSLRLGVHSAEHRRDPDRRLLARLLDAGPVRLVTLAPELSGACALVRDALARDVVVSFGHSDATATEAHAAFGLGPRTVTHLFNAMRPFHHREPGLAGAALARDDVVVQLILDGRHVATETAAIAWRAARGRVALVTDATAEAGSMTADGVLAGGSATLIDAVRNLHALGASLEEAIGAATVVPARVLGSCDVGRLAPGLPADVVLLDDSLEVERVLVAGVERYSR